MDPERYPLRDYAENLLVDLNPEKADEELQFRQHVYALGKLAGRSGSNCRELAKYLWSDSNRALQGGSGTRLPPCNRQKWNLLDRHSPILQKGRVQHRLHSKQLPYLLECPLRQFPMEDRIEKSTRGLPRNRERGLHHEEPRTSRLTNLPLSLSRHRALQ